MANGHGSWITELVDFAVKAAATLFAASLAVMGWMMRYWWRKSAVVEDHDEQLYDDSEGARISRMKRVEDRVNSLDARLRVQEQITQRSEQMWREVNEKLTEQGRTLYNIEGYVKGNAEKG